MMISSVASVKFIKTKVIFWNDTKGVSNQVSSNSDHEIKSYSCSNSSIKTRKNEKAGKNFWVTKRGNKEITNRGSFYGLQIEARGITNRVQGYRFQIRTKRIEIGAGISNR